MRRRRAPHKSRLIHSWSGTVFRIGKVERAHKDAAPEFANAPHCGPVDADFDHCDSLVLDTQDGHLQRVTLQSEAA